MKTFEMLAMVAVSGFGLSVPAHAQCVTVDPVVVPDLRIDPLDATSVGQMMQPVFVTFRRAGADEGPVHVVYQIVDEDSGPTQRVGITAGPQLEWRSGDTGRTVGAARNDAYALLRSSEVSMAADESSKQSTLRLFLPNLREDLAAGVYREQFTIRYWCTREDNPLPHEIPGIVTVTVQVPNVLSANIAGASTRGEIDFMDFASLSRALSVSVRSTGPYAVSAQSLNGSAMLRDGARSNESADRIPYVVTFGGRPLTLGMSSSFTSPRAGLSGQQIPINVSVEDISTKRAGSYSDTLILTLSPIS